MNQRELIISACKKRWTSGLDALGTAGTMKLSTRLGEYREGLGLAGYVILDRWKTVTSKTTGKVSKYKEYRIVKIKA